MKTTVLLKKAGAILLCLALVLSCAACGSSSTQSQTTAADTASASGGYSAADLPAETVIDTIYSVNNLKTVLENHSSVGVQIVCTGSDNQITYSKYIQATRQDDGCYVRIHLDSAAGSGEMEGSTAAGFVACRWEDGSLEVACSARDEFYSLVQESYLEPHSTAQFNNVTVADAEGGIAVTADVTYDDSTDVYKTTYLLDKEDLHILTITEDYYQSQGGTLTTSTLYYDTAMPYTFADCTVLNDVQNSSDAVGLHIMYVVPEQNYINVENYTMSASVHPIVDSEGYVNVFSSSDLSQDSMVSLVTPYEDATYYAVVTSFNLMQANQMAASDFQNSTNVVYATTGKTGDTAATAAPTATPAAASGAVTVTANPSDVTVAIGGTATFTAAADNATSITWNITNSDGSYSVVDVDADNFFGGLHVNGIGTNTLTLTNIPAIMDGWKVQCIFGGQGDPAYTTAAVITVSEMGASTTTAPYAYAGSQYNNNQSTTIQPASNDPASVAQTLANNSVSDVANRISSWGWTCSSVSEYAYNAEKQQATYDILCSCRGTGVTFHFIAYPTLNYAIPVSYEGSDGDLHSFSSNVDQASCWAEFGTAIVYLTPATSTYTAPTTPTISNGGGWAGSSGSAYDSGSSGSSSSGSSSSGSSQPAQADTPIDTSTYGASAGSGSFSSSQSDKLVMTAEWSAVTESADTVRVTVNVTLQSATITTTSRPLSISVNGQTASFMAPGFSYDENSWHYTPLGSYSFSVPASGSCTVPLEVHWSFNGSYSGVSIGDLVCSGSISINR